MIICSEEELYVLRLADVIADREELDLQVQVCTSFEQAERLEEFQGAELLLIGDEIPYEKRQMSRAARRFVLTSQEGTEVGEEEIPIYKYQSVRRIFAQIVRDVPGSRQCRTVPGTEKGRQASDCRLFPHSPDW